MARDSNFDTSFLNNGRYIYFYQLFHESDNTALRDIAVAKAIEYTTYSKSFSPESLKKKKNSQALTYIKNYIQMLEQLVASERAAEEEFIQALNSNMGQGAQKAFIHGNRFDYIEFIKVLNELLRNEAIIKDVIHENIKNIKDIDDGFKDLQSQVTDKRRKFPSFEQLQSMYKTQYSNYTSYMSRLIDDKLAPSLAGKIQQYITTNLKSLLDPEQLKTKFSRLETIARQQLNYTDIFNILVQHAAEKLQNYTGDPNTFAGNFYDEITQDEDKAYAEMQKAITEHYDKMFRDYTSDLEAILDLALQNKGRIASKILENNALYDTMMTAINNLTNNGETLKGKRGGKTPYSQMYDFISKYRNKIQEETPEAEYNKRNLTRRINALLREILRVEKRKTFVKKEERRQEAMKIVGSQFAKIDNKRYALTATALSKSYITVPSTAEIIASPKLKKELEQQFITFTPGSEIQLKADLVFHYSPADLRNEVQKIIKKTDLSKMQTIENFSQNFLTQYKKDAKGATDIEQASQTWIAEKRKVIKAQDALLKKASKEDKEKLTQWYESILNGGISVKEYTFYNNELGFHMGSLGGSGKVVSAIPNILKMLDLGGISNQDVDLIVDILLNSFPQSIIGTKCVDNIKNLLIGGAAMMLFDDGFANAENFLQTQANALKVDEGRLGKTVHLLYLKNVYIPQSYILENIVEQLKLVYNEIYQLDADGILTGKGNNQFLSRNQLYIDNPITTGTYKRVENINDPETRWKEMRKIAEDSVKIGFLFMGGMLDIMQQLEKAFNPQV